MATRLERVVLELDDQFTTPMARAAASTALLNRELDSLSKDTPKTKRALGDVDTEVTKVGRSSNTSGKEIDKLSGRLNVLRDVAVILGPALIPVGAVAVPAVAGLASELGFATIAAGTAVLAFQGVGDALAAVNKAGLEPTQANLEAARVALSRIGPDAANLVNQLHELQPEIRGLRDAAAAGLLPGVGASIASLESALPRIENVVSSVAGALGDIAADTGESLASDRWEPFLDFIADEAPAALSDLASIVGSTAHGLAELWMAFEPVNQDFSQWLVDAADDFDGFAEGLDQTEGFQDFINYVRENGPQVAETFGAIADATVQIVQAASPLGGPVLEGVEGFAKAVSAIADSDLGTPLFTAAAALSLFNRGLKATESLSAFGGRLDVAGTKARRFGDNLNRANLAKSAALLGGVAIAGTGAADSIGLTNTASLGFAGTIGGPLGIAVGSAVGFTLDLAHANDEVTAALDRSRAAADSNSIAQVRAAQAALIGQANQLASGNSFTDNLGRISAFIAGNDRELADQADSLNVRLRELQDGPLSGMASLLTQGLGRPARQAAADVDGAATAAARLNDQMAGLTEKLSQSQRLIQQRDAMRDLADVVKENPKGRGLTTGPGDRGAQGDAVRSQLLSIIGLTLQASQGLNDLDQISFLRRQRANILQAAKDLGLPLEAVTKLLDAFKIVGQTDLKPKVDVKSFQKDIGQAKTALEKFLDGDFQVKIRPVLTGEKALNQLLLGPVSGGKGFAGGGFTGPGGRYEPKGIVHAGEVVLPDWVVKRDQVELVHRYGFLPGMDQLKGYANGGWVDPGWRAPASPRSQPTVVVQAASGGVVDMDELRDLVAQMRPLIGNMTVQPHDYSQFEREMQQKRRMHSALGYRP